MSFTPYIKHDQTADAAYVYLSPVRKVAQTRCVDDYRMVDYGRDGRVLGVELLEVSDGVDLDGIPERETIRRLLQDIGIEVTEPAQQEQSPR